MRRNRITLLVIPLILVVVIVGWLYSQENNVDNMNLNKVKSSDATSAGDYQQSKPDPMSLIVIMDMMLSNMQKVDAGIYNENYGLIEESAGRIADHPPIRKKDLQLIKETLGNQMKTFAKFDNKVHHHADSMRMAAHQKDMDEILRHYSIVQSGCVSCHAHFRSRILKAQK